MTIRKNPEYLLGLLHELGRLPLETEWVEFKVDNNDPQAIGEYISALANSAVLCGKPRAYMAWGIQNRTHDVVGTRFSPATQRKGNEPLETWLLRLLRPHIDFQFHEIPVGERRVILLEIASARQYPVAFSGVEFIRVGSAKRKLKDFPAKEQALWRAFNAVKFEDGVAAERMSVQDVLHTLDYPTYFALLDAPLPDGHAAILDGLRRDRLIRPCEAGGFDVMNLGAILFAKRLEDFTGLKRKAARVMQYRDTGRMEALKEREGNRGYASGFEGLVTYVNAALPANEVLRKALREAVPMYPEIAVRELVANALIHQDFLVTGAGPTVEIFNDRIEITNPGEPLVDTQRFVDTPPQSRNEALASLMRRFGICEERGSGIDKVVFQAEFYQLPAPLFEAPKGFTRTVLFAPKALASMDKSERVRACYLHACLKRVMQDYLTNASLRERFGIKTDNKAIASRYIREAVDTGMIKPFDEHAAKRMMKYVPFWA